MFYSYLSCLNIFKSYFKHIILLPYDYHMAKYLHVLTIWLRFHMVTIWLKTYESPTIWKSYGNHMNSWFLSNRMVTIWGIFCCVHRSRKWVLSSTWSAEQILYFLNSTVIFLYEYIPVSITSLCVLILNDVNYFLTCKLCTLFRYVSLEKFVLKSAYVRSLPVWLTSLLDKVLVHDDIKLLTSLFLNKQS